MDFIDTLKSEKITLTVGNFEILRLGDFFRLFKYKDELRQAIKDKDRVKFRQVIKDIIELQTKMPAVLVSLANTLTDVLNIFSANRIQVDAAFLNITEKDKEKGKIRIKASWEYDGRELAVWINSFAERYHWSLNDILNLPVNTAVYLYQEILINSQFEREWQYNLSELAYQYDENTQKNKFVPLTRPEWMVDGSVQPDGIIRTTKMLKSMLPFGIVIDQSGMGILSANEQAPKNIPTKEEFTG